MKLLNFLLLLAASNSIGASEPCEPFASAPTLPALQRLQSTVSPYLAVESKYLPPPLLYHFGSQSILLKDTGLSGVPIDDWNKFIMGTSDRFGLSQYRRGFYGCSRPAWCESYAEDQSGKVPWFLAISIQPECRKPEAVTVIHLLAQDSRFLNWFANASVKDFSSVSDFDEKCLQHWNLDLTGGTEGPCETLLSKYFSAAKVRVVLDEGMPDFESPAQSSKFPNSWYIRDRTCLGPIRGNANEELELMADPKFWENPATSYAPIQRGSEKFFKNFLTALDDAKNVKSQTLQAIQREALKNRSDGFNDLLAHVSVGSAIQSVIESYDRCRTKNQDQSFHTLTTGFLSKTVTAAEFLNRLPNLCP